MLHTGLKQLLAGSVEMLRDISSDEAPGAEVIREKADVCVRMSSKRAPSPRVLTAYGKSRPPQQHRLKVQFAQSRLQLPARVSPRSSAGHQRMVTDGH